MLEKMEKTVVKREPNRMVDKIKKMMRVLMAAGILTLGTGSYKYLAEGAETTMQKPQTYIEYVERNYKRIDESKKEVLRQELEYLSQQYSPYIIEHLEKKDKFARESRQKIPANPSVSGFEKLGLDNKKLKELWSKKHYPAELIEGNVEKIELKEAKGKRISGYQSGRIIAAEVAAFNNDIAFFQHPGQKEDLSQKAQIEALDWMFSHELGHKADGIKNIKFTPEERVRFFYEITQAFNQPGSFRDITGEIDSISLPDKNAEKYYKVREYWAEMVQYYLTFPDLVKKRLSANEIALIKKWLEKNDPTFNALKAKRDKDRFIEENFR